MRKITMCLIGAMTVLSLAACTPTTEKNARQSNGSGSVKPPVNVEETTKEVVEKLPDLDAPVLEMAFIYSGNSDATGLVRNTEDVESLDEDTLVDLLIQYGVLEEGTTSLSFVIEGGEKAGPGAAAADSSGERVGILDLSAVPESGTAGEQVILASIANTFTENFELDKLKLLVNGENYSSGHVEHGDEDYLYYEDKYEKFQN